MDEVTGTTAMSGDFDAVFRRTFGSLLEKEGKPISHERVAGRLRETYEMLSTENAAANFSPTEEYVACLKCQGVDDSPCKMGEAAVLLGEESEYNILKSVEILGNSYMREFLYEDAYICYKMAHIYYVNKFGIHFVKSRLLKMKVVKSLLELKQYSEVLNEAVHEVEENSYGTPLDAGATMFIKYAFGFSLMYKGSFKKAVPYLVPSHLGEMNTEVEENMKLLGRIFETVHDAFSGGKVEFATALAAKLLKVFRSRLERVDCPFEVFEFATTFADKLWASNHKLEYSKLYLLASEFHETRRNHDTTLLVLAIECSSGRRSIALRKVKLDPRRMISQNGGVLDARAVGKLNKVVVMLHSICEAKKGDQTMSGFKYEDIEQEMVNHLQDITNTLKNSMLALIEVEKRINSCFLKTDRYNGH